MVLVLFDNNINEWKIITLEEKNLLPEEEKNKVLYLDGKLKIRLDFAKAQIKNNNDCVGLIEGPEGSGKSSVAGNIMRYMTNDKFDPKVQLIGSDYQDALDKLEMVEDKGALMFDEGNAFFLATETMTREHRDLHKIFSIFRQKNLFVLIVLPSFFRLGSYFAVDRSKFLLRTYLRDGKRGYFAYYGDKRKGKLYRLGRKFYDYNVVKPTIRGRFTQCMTLENPEYKNFKLKTLKEAFSRAKDKHKSPTEIRREVLNSIINANPSVSSLVLSEMTGIPASTIRTSRQRNRKCQPEEVN